MSNVKSAPSVGDPYLKINAKPGDPVFTTYGSAIERGRLYGDKAYKMHYDAPSEPLFFESEQAGRFFTGWKIKKIAIDEGGKYHEPPRVCASFSDMALLRSKPFEGVTAKETFFVYSSRIALIDSVVKNELDSPITVEAFGVYENDEFPLTVTHAPENGAPFVFEREETLERDLKALYAERPYPTKYRDLFATDGKPDSWGAYDFGKRPFWRHIKNNDLLDFSKEGGRRIALHKKFTIEPGERARFRFVRATASRDEDVEQLREEVEKLRAEPLDAYVEENEKRFASVPRLNFKTEEERQVYLSAFNLARGCMLPPEGETKFNYYVFSRNPIWGWGHGHQVLHESLTMLAYAHMDAKSAMDSQRVYIEQQSEDGLIAYRHGPRGAQTYPHEGKPTTSAPFFSWINWEIFQIAKDREFLAEAYEAGDKYVEWLKINRDVDQDGLFEWGPYGIIENVRDWFNAVFQVTEERRLDKGELDISDKLECLDLSLMVVKEMRSLAAMADELGKSDAAERHRADAERLTTLINDTMWDEESEFYYHVDRDDHTFVHKGKDLKRREIIAFLTLWAEAAPKDRAEKLMKTLLDPDVFWRKNGVPTLAADDPWYGAFVEQCCKWNGPVWLLWDYMVFQGLLLYGYKDAARELGEKMLRVVTTQLAKNHNFWESFSPDYDAQDSPPNYVWDAIIARVLIDLYRLDR